MLKLYTVSLASGLGASFIFLHQYLKHLDYGLVSPFSGASIAAWGPFNPFISIKNNRRQKR